MKTIRITKEVSTVNTTYKKNRDIKYIVLHYTAGTKSTSGSALNTAAYFSSGHAGGSADYIVDDSTTVQYNPDIKNRYCWSVGGNKYNHMTTSEGGKFYGKCTNTNSISIEMCSNKIDKKPPLCDDATDWYFTKATIANAVELTRYLMQTYNISTENVIMHHHVTGKVCPNPWCVNSSRLDKWKEFKSMLAENTEEIFETVNIEVNGQDIKADAILKDNATFIKLRAFKNVGFTIGYNKETKLITLDNESKKLTLNIENDEKTVDSINIKGHNFVSLREIIEMLGLRLEFDDTSGKIIIIK